MGGVGLSPCCVPDVSAAKMSLQDLLLSAGPSTLLAGVALLLLLFVLSRSGSGSGAPRRREPPGPRPLPLLGNLLQLNLSRPQQTLCEVDPARLPVEHALGVEKEKKKN